MMNILLINQLAIDFYTCLMIIATFGINLVNIYYSGTSGYLLCLMLSSEQLMWIALNASEINLVVIAVERYVKIVHSIWHKNHFKLWMVYFGCAFSWVSGFLGNFFPFLFGTYIFDGQCMAVMQFPSLSGRMVFIWFTYLYFYQLPVLIFAICYARIFQVIRRQNRIFRQNPKDTAAVASSSSAATDASRKSWRSQVNAVKTMIFTTVFFALFWMPIYVYLVVTMTLSPTFERHPVWYAAEFMALFNICANPFIYIVSYDDIRVYLSKKLIDSRINLLKMFRRQAVGIVSIQVYSLEYAQTAATTG
jgi:hypothetical protein